QVAVLVSVDQAGDAASDLSQQSLHLLLRAACLLALSLQTTLVFLMNALRIGQERTHVGPHGIVELIGPALFVGTHPLTAKAISVATNAAIIGVITRLAF